MTRKTFHESRSAMDFTPVPRRTRKDGWTPERQRNFMETLARTGSLRAAAASVNMSEAGAIYLRNQPGAESFDAAWDAALATGSERVRDVLVDHALNGIPEDVYHAGRVVGQRRRFNHQSMMWIVETGKRREAAKGAQTLTRGMIEEARAVIQRRITAIKTVRLRTYVGDPVKRAAYETLYGPVDWTPHEKFAFSPSDSPPPCPQPDTQA